MYTITEILTKPAEGLNNFVYIVHGLIDWHDGREMEERVKKILDSDGYCASLIGHLDPEIAEKHLDGYRGEVHHVQTLGTIGLIVRPQSDEDIKIAWNRDVGSPDGPAELKKFVELHEGKRKTPFQLLTQTKLLYNELIIKSGRKPEIEGVFYQEEVPRAKYEATVLSEIVERITHKEVPIVKIPLPKIKNYEEFPDLKTRELARVWSFWGLMEDMTEYSFSLTQV